MFGSSYIGHLVELGFVKLGLWLVFEEEKEENEKRGVCLSQFEKRKRKKNYFHTCGIIPT